MHKQTLFKNYSFGIINHGQLFKHLTTATKIGNIQMY